MQAFEFSSIIEDRGIIHIPEQYLKKITSPVKIILIANEEKQETKTNDFSAICLKTKNFKFAREIANER